MSKSLRTSAKVSKTPAPSAHAVGDTAETEGKSSPDDRLSHGISKSERTRKLILEQAAPLFNKQGFAGTSLGDLTEATGLTKGALYGNFKDKEGIALAAFGYSMQKVRKIMKARLDPLPTNKRRLIELLEFFGEYVMHPPIPGGCPIMNYGVEADDGERFMRRPVGREMQSTMAFIQHCLESGKERDEFSSTTDAAAVAQVIFCAVEGAIVVSRVTGTPAPMDAVVKHCKSILDQLSC